jgi:hypothetical protein
VAADPEHVRRNHRDFLLHPYGSMSGDLCNGRGLADARRADEGRYQTRSGMQFRRWSNDQLIRNLPAHSFAQFGWSRIAVRSARNELVGDIVIDSLTDELGIQTAR